MPDKKNYATETDSLPLAVPEITKLFDESIVPPHQERSELSHLGVDSESGLSIEAGNGSTMIQLIDHLSDLGELME